MARRRMDRTLTPHICGTLITMIHGNDNHSAPGNAAERNRERRDVGNAKRHSALLVHGVHEGTQR